MAAWCENAFRREAQRVLGKMIKHWRLAPVSDGYALSRSGKAAAKGTVDDALVQDLLRRGLIAQSGAGYAISEAGCAWLARQAADGDPYAAQQRVIETRAMQKDGKTVHVPVNLAESPLTMLHRRKLIDDDGLAAGERLRRDYTLAQMTPRMTVDWSAPCMPGRRAAKPDHLTDSVLAAKQRFNAAMHAVGPELSGLLFDLCCALHGLEICEKQRGWPRASAKVVLNIALGKLARHYGIGMCRMNGPVRRWISEPDHPPEAC